MEPLAAVVLGDYAGVAAGLERVLSLVLLGDLVALRLGGSEQQR